MDLKDLITEYLANGEEAFRAFNAGHPETSEKLFRQNEKLIEEYFKGKATPTGDVKKSASMEKTEDEQKEKPAAVPGASLRPGPFGPAQDAPKGSAPQQEPKQTE